MILVPDFGLYLALSVKSFKVKSKSLALKCRLRHKRLMNSLMETIALPQDQEQHISSTGILSCREKMSTIIPLHGLLTVGVWACHTLCNFPYFCTRIRNSKVHIDMHT